MSVIKINKENFASEVLNSNKPVLLDFYADWCGPCRMVGPIVSEIANERSDVKVGKINVDEMPELAAQFQVMSIPMLAVIKNGKLENQVVGYRPKEQIESMLEGEKRWDCLISSATPSTSTPVLRNTKQTTAPYCLTLGRQRNTVTGTLTEASTYLLIEFLPLRIPSRTKAHRFMCIV